MKICCAGVGAIGVPAGIGSEEGRRVIVRCVQSSARRRSVELAWIEKRGNGQVARRRFSRSVHCSSTHPFVVLETARRANKVGRGKTVMRWPAMFESE